MSKPVLGRGLGSLLSSRPKPTVATGTAEVSPGVAVLINGTQADRDTGAPSPAVPLAQQMKNAAREAILRGILVAADLLLCLMAFLFAQRQPSLQFHELALCVAAVVIGGALSCVAVLGEGWLAVRMDGTNGCRSMRVTQSI